MGELIPVPVSDRIFFDMPDPTPADLEDPVFNAIYEATKDWDVGAPKHHSGHTGMTGSHVMVILNAVRKAKQSQVESRHPGMHYQRMDPQPEAGVTNWRPGYKSIVNDSLSFRIGLKLYTPPAGMRGAQPWHDRDGDWYWRKELDR